ncbi:hypothetical protein Ade02nite_83260 [Paractinoplanes deccanensis]|uniref:DUF4179 domain-containing protein n=1 Tax=Paractinoplanes deccanensis TaxID=113561 RepID=A0ABQ3YI43_9ACTN|nr:hypothetical protein [Actinoplanes deccanensis]GID79685.1 hypothetical protein Ade02nite_83260 [Actinoplanes deccanensis]
MSTETTLRDALAAEAGALGVPDSPWPRFAKRERAHRRNRRIRIAAVAALIMAIGGVQSGLVPVPGWAPGIAVAGRETALAKSPLRGSLARDAQWLAGMRAAIKDVADPGELWQVASRDKIRFLYAGDVAGRRLALALVPLRFGFLADETLLWYEGAPGAAPSEMRESTRTDGGDTVAVYRDGRTDSPGTLVVVAPAGSTVAVSIGFRYTAAGRVEHAEPHRGAPGSGLAEITLPAAPFDPGTTVTVTGRDGRSVYDGPAYGAWSGHSTGDPREPSEESLTAALGEHTLDRLTLRRWVENALHDARLPAEGTTAKVRWTGTVNGQTAALITVQPQGGGVLAYATHGGADSYRQDLRLLLPAAGVDERPIAWRMRAEGRDDRTDQVVIVAPPGTARLSVGGEAAVPDASGAAFASLPSSATASVTAYAADGSVIGTTPVPPFETDSGGIPGDDLKTRIVE